MIWLAARQTPDFRTINRFRVEKKELIEEVFKAIVLRLIDAELRLYTKSGAWKNSSPGFLFLYTKRQISNIIKV